MKSHPFILAIFEGKLHACAQDEHGKPLLEYGTLHWKPVKSSAPPDFLEEARELFDEPFEVEE